MPIPFTATQFFEVIADYNRAVWPAPVVLQALAVLALVLVAWPRRPSGAVISAILSVLWAWTGLAYHLAFFTAINPLAHVFAAASLAAAVVFFVEGVVRRRLAFRLALNARSMLGAGLVVFALLVYPVWTSLAGHRYPELPTFGLPCPTTLFTIGLLAQLVAPHPRSPLLVPVAWCAVGAQAALLFGVQADLALLVAGALGIAQWMRAKPRAAVRAAAP